MYWIILIIIILYNLVHRPVPSFSMLHAEKWEFLRVTLKSWELAGDEANYLYAIVVHVIICKLMFGRKNKVNNKNCIWEESTCNNLCSILVKTPLYFINY